ncbi:MAG: hypothetical protein HGA23_10790 [Bacteroidales bacterium]|nr:hypothetical protein [Bacteroidales bacterium]
MSEPTTFVPVMVDAGQVFQEIDGFGVNINSRYWKGEALLPAMDILLDGLGATLFRVDIWGKSNWIDPTSVLGKEALYPARLEEIYRGEVFQRGWPLMRYLNQRGIRPYLTASGDVPAWMLAEDGKTLADDESFCEMLVSMILNNNIKTTRREFERMKKDTLKYDLSEIEFRKAGYEFIGSRSYAEAVAILEMGIELYPESSMLFAEMGEAYLMHGDKEKSLESWKRAAALDPENPNGKYLIENFDAVFNQIHTPKK